MIAGLDCLLVRLWKQVITKI